LATLRSVLAAAFRRAHLGREITEELRFHFESRIDDLERSGLTREDAKRQARIEFGGLERYKQECRESAGAGFVDVLLQDLSFAVRLLSKSPGFASIAVLTLALGIGANTGIFSLLSAVLLRPLPYAHPQQLVLLFENNLPLGVKETGCSYPDLEALRDSHVFASVAGVNRHALILTGAGEPSELDTVVVTPEMFPLLGVKPLSGRYLLPEDGRPGAPPAVVISEALWRSRFGSSPALVSRSIVLDQKAFTVVGIMPAAFRVPVFGERQDIWIPVAQDPLFGGWVSRRGGHWLRVVGQLRPDSSLRQAQTEAAAVSARLATQFPAENGGWTVQVAPLQKAIVADFRTPLLVLSGAVGLVLLLACVNVANLLLARATARTRELSVRRALGAERGRLIRQLFTESALIGLLGSVLGVALAYTSIKGLSLLFPPDSPSMRQVQIDAPVLAFAVLVAFVSTVLFGLAPALVTTKWDFQANLRDSAARSGSAAGPLRLRRFLAAAEIALAALIVVCATLLVRSLISITSVNPGFRVQQVLKADVSLPRNRYSTPQQWRAFSRALLERVHATPGLQDSSMAVPVPLGDGFVNLAFSIPDHPPLPRGTPSTADYVAVTPDYFHVMGIGLLRGRSFTPLDSEKAPDVALISESFARLYFRGENPVGKKLVFGFPPDGNRERTIIGVVGNVRDANLTQEPGPMMYVPFIQAPFWGGNLVVHSNLSVAATVAAIRKVVYDLDPDVPVSGVVTMQDVLAAYVAQPRVRTMLLSGFGLMALLLAGLGIFGVLSCSVVTRVREFGIRAALGATPTSLGRVVILEGLMLGIGGLVVGLTAAAGVVHFLRSQLYGVTAYDPAAFFGTAAILLMLVLVSCYVPVSRVMHLDPVVALRNE
jgi:putative ABC transport system permease protein